MSSTSSQVGHVDQVVAPPTSDESLPVAPAQVVAAEAEMSHCQGMIQRQLKTEAKSLFDILETISSLEDPELVDMAKRRLEMGELDSHPIKQAWQTGCPLPAHLQASQLTA